MQNIRHQLKRFTPSWLQARYIFRYLYSVALTADAVIETGVQAMAARLPGYGTPSALPRIARDRLMYRGFAESDEDFAARAALWLDEHKSRASAVSVLRQVQAYCSPKRPRCRLIVTQATANRTVYTTLNTDGTIDREIVAPKNWVWDGHALNSRAWLVIYSTGADAPWQRDVQLWNDDPTDTWPSDADAPTVRETFGSDATFAQINGLRDLVRTWKAAHSLYPFVIVAWDDGLFDPTDTSPPNPDGTWEFDGRNDTGAPADGGNFEWARDPDAIYWTGTG